MDAHPETNPQDWIEQYGDRTSSFASQHPGFRSYPNLTGQGGLRYTPTAHAWVLAAEPLTPTRQRTAAFLDWAGQAQTQGCRAIAFPISEELAQDIRHRGGDAVPIGQEPIFDLAQLFADPQNDPLQYQTRARSLLTRGGLRIIELSRTQVTALQPAIEALRDDWLDSRKGPGLGFLSQSRPLENAEKKRYFAAFAGDRLEALLSAVPLVGNGIWYFLDLIRHPDSRPGTIEGLEIEAMRTLHQQGATEVRLGLCPFTGLENHTDWRAKWIGLSAHRLEFLYGFASARRFKEKLGPTSWTTLYAASPTRMGVWALHAAAEAHLGPRPLRRLAQQFLIARSASWLRPQALTKILNVPRLVPTSFALFASLHLARHIFAPMQSLFERSAYRPETVTFTGFLLSPVFHTTPYHFLGNVLSLLFFGIFAEALLPRAVTASVLAFGLWASNPLTQLLVTPWLPQFDPAGYAHFLAEWDYGSSNAVYALVGAFAALVKSPRIVLLPFVLNGLFLCLALNSWLSLHHLVGLLGGYGIARAATRR